MVQMMNWILNFFWISRMQIKWRDLRSLNQSLKTDTEKNQESNLLESSEIRLLVTTKKTWFLIWYNTTLIMLMIPASPWSAWERGSSGKTTKMIGKMTQTKRYHFNLAFSLKGKLHIQKLFTLDMKSKYGKDLDKDFLSKMGPINDAMRVR